MNIYFAGPIRGGRQDKEMYFDIIKLLSGFGTVLTEHVGDKTLSELGEDGPTEQHIYTRDMSALQLAEVLVAEVTTPSLGVGYEIAKAEEWNKYVVCLYRPTETKRLSAMIRGNKGLRLIEYTSLHDLKKHFKKIFA